MADVAEGRLPAVISSALARADLPADSLALWVAPVGQAAPRLSYQADRSVNPASVMKLVTSAVALDLLSANYSWVTPVTLRGPVVGDVLQGDLVIEGRGDPKLVTERLGLLMQQVRQRGVRRISGDIVLDRRAFAVTPRDPGAFDGERYRPYNVQPDALSVNQKSLILGFYPDPSRGVARISVDPPLAGARWPTELPLADGPCGDWRGSLQADFSNPLRLRFGGRFAAACGDKTWPVAPGEPERFNARAIEAAWEAAGGRLDGRVRDRDEQDGDARSRPQRSTSVDEAEQVNRMEPSGPRQRGSTAATITRFDFPSPTLGEVLRDMNKYSNNVIAQHLFLSLAWPVRNVRSAAFNAAAANAGNVTPSNNLPSGGPVADAAAPPAPATWEAARDVASRWVRERAGCAADVLRIDNGSGLSRDERITARCLAGVLQTAWASPWMPEFLASLPQAGEHTARRATSVLGRAHLKTGSLNNVAAVSGVVLAPSGRRYVVVAILNHPRADSDGGRAALDAVLGWVAQDGERAAP